MTDNIYAASIYRITAVSFWESAKILDTTMEKDSKGLATKITLIAPFYFLISHTTELLLKSALLKRGLSEKDLKKYDYRHSLEKLLEELKKKGVYVTDATTNLIEGLHKQHKNHELRYTIFMDDGQKTYMPPPLLLFSMLDELLMLTRISTQGI
jgi:hypothetical protein